MGITALPVITSVPWTTADHTEPCGVLRLYNNLVPGKQGKPPLGLGEGRPTMF